MIAGCVISKDRLQNMSTSALLRHFDSVSTLSACCYMTVENFKHYKEML